MNRNYRPPEPAGWKAATVGEIFRVVGGGTPSTSEPRFWQGPTPWVTSADIEDGRIFPKRAVSPEAIDRSATNLVPAGSVVVVTRVGLGKVGIAESDLCFSQDCQGLLCDSAYLEPRFVLYQMSRAVSGFVAIARGTTINGVTKEQLRDTPFVLAPRNEQTRIVEAIESYSTRLDGAVATLERVKANLKRYRASVLKAAVEGRLVPTEAELARKEGREYEPASVLLDRVLRERRSRWEEAELARLAAKGREPKVDRWEEKYAGPAGPDTSQLPELPQGWCWVTLPQVGELDRGTSKHRPRNDARLLGGPYPFIQTGEVRQADGHIENYETTYSEFGLHQSRLWPAGTLCITIAANIAETGILKFDACFPDSVVGFSCPERPILVRFVEFFLRTARERLHRYAPATAQKNINLKTLSSLAVPMPPEAEQARIVAEIDRLFSVVRTTGAVASDNVARCRRLHQSILNWAFEGKLVDQSPSDEPASVLLDRIKSERGKSMGVNQKTPRERTNRKTT